VFEELDSHVAESITPQSMTRPTSAIREIRGAMRLVPRHTVLRIRRWLRSSEAATILLAVSVGLCAGLATGLLGTIAHYLQQLIYGIGINRLSALTSIRHPVKLLALPLAGLLLALLARWIPQKTTPIDVVEANALHGGRVPLADSALVCLQTLISNGFGASVGLEAAYAQAGGGIASLAGRISALRRADLRILVGAGAGAAVGAAFGAPLAGAFYAFEIVIGAYTPAAIAPVAAASLAATLVTRGLGFQPYLVAAPATAHITTLSYLLFAGLGVTASVCGIAIMRLQAALERLLARVRMPQFWRPVIGGALLMPIAWLSPQSLSAGHGALRLELVLHPAASFLLLIFALKALASIVSLSFGFRGGLFFASLFLGTLLGPAYAQALNETGLGILINEQDAALVGMAALAVTIVGGPMTLSLLVLEVTHDFALTGVVITAALCASAFTRAHFGYSFSTWRLHLRGTAIRSARDIGWMTGLTAGRMMRRDPVVVDADLTIAAFRIGVPLGSTSRAVLSRDGIYAGIVSTAEVFDPTLDPAALLSDCAQLKDAALTPDMDLGAVLDRFEQLETEDLAVTDSEGRILGALTEKYVQRRYIEESEKVQSALFGE
jgi:CIC family chloride channel protein